jgi:hypothetical protein
MKRIDVAMCAVLLLLVPACGDDEKAANGLTISQNNTTNGATNANTQTNMNPNGQPNGTPNAQPNGNPNTNTGNNGGLNVNASCPPEARPVYVVEAEQNDISAQGRLVRWNSQERTFTDIGELACPTFEGNTPFSMSVDREGVAWVLYQSGEIFHVSTTDASCEATSFQVGQNGYDVFGMGFVLNEPTMPAETLYIAGGSINDIGLGSARLGFLGIPSLSVTDLAPLNGWPEMSGTANAELWAFFPQGNPPRVASLDRVSGEELQTYPVDIIDGQPNAWAFAHWGGNFYLFYKSQSDPSTRVFELIGDTGEVTEIVSDSGRYIVGAGVSTCAPTIIN